MIRTTIRLPDDLLDHAKACARRTGRTLTRLIEDAVRAELVQHASHLHRAVREDVVRYNVSNNSTTAERSEPARAAGTASAASAQIRERLNLQISDLQTFLSAIPDRDRRTADEILGYDASGLPG